MAKVVITLSDDEETDALEVSAEFIPELNKEEFDAGSFTEAQATGLLFLQALATDTLGADDSVSGNTNDNEDGENATGS